MKTQSNPVALQLWRVSPGLLAAFTGTALLAVADKGVSQTIDEITVTTRRTEENLQDIPVAVTALNADLIAKQAISTTADVVDLVPGVQFDQSFSAADTRISIRGVNSSRGRTSAAVLIDGIDVTGENISAGGGSSLLNTRLLDLERVEIVKGPQSALYGRNAFAGAISYISKMPSLEESAARASVEIAQHGTTDVRGSLSGPVIDGKLALGINVGSYRTDGFYRNNNPNSPAANVDLGGVESDGIRLTGVWDFSDAITVTGALSYTETEADPRAVAKVGNANSFFLMGTQLDPTTMAGSIPFDNSAGLQDYGMWLGSISSVSEDDINLSLSERTGRPFAGSEDEILHTYVKVNWEFANVTLKSSSSYLEADATLEEDVDFQDGLGSQAFAFAPPPFTSNVFLSLSNEYVDETETKQASQEFTLESNDWAHGNWLIGVNGFWEKAANADRSLNWTNDPAYPTDPAFGIFCGTFPEFGQVACGFPAAVANGLPPKRTWRDTESYSLFGLANIDLSDALRLTLEARYIRDDIEVRTNTAVSRVDQTLLNYPIDGAFGMNPPQTIPAIDEVDSDTINPRVALDFKSSDDVMFYGSVAKGTKPAGFGTTQFATPQSSRIKQEKLWAYELGTKTRWNEGTVQVNAAVFFNDYTDKQVGVTRFIPYPASSVTNASGAETKGLEVDVTWQPIEPLTLAFAYAYTDAEYTDFDFAAIRGAEGDVVRPKDMAVCGNVAGNCDGAEIAGIPENAATLVADWKQPLDSGAELFTNATIIYTDERPLSDQVRTAYIDSHTKVNWQVGLQTEQWTALVYADNLFDDDTPLWAQSSNDFRDGIYNLGQPRDDTAFVFLPPERQIGFRFSYDF